MIDHAGIQQCVFIVSFPRSGTHLLLDFIRRNFPGFNPTLWFWESASKLYLSLDSQDWAKQADQFRRARSHLLAQSHQAGYIVPAVIEARRFLAPQRDIVLYPFRKFSKTIESYAELCHSQVTIDKFLNSKDTFLNPHTTVVNSIRSHATHWMGREAVFVDCDQLMENPETMCARLGKLLGHQPASLGRRLPRRKRFGGKAGELLQRVSGRESTEVKISCRIKWQAKEANRLADDALGDLYQELKRRSDQF